MNCFRIGFFVSERVALKILFMEEPPSEIQISATSAPTDRTDSRQRGSSLLVSEAVCFSPISLLEQLKGIIRWSMFLAHERFVSNVLHCGYLRKICMLSICFAASNETR